MLDQQKEAFREEAGELLADLESALLELEESPGDLELVGKVFRAMHTIKGSGAMFGFDQVSAFTHEVETVYDRVRGGEVAVTSELVNLSLEARDHIKAMLHDPDSVVEERTLELVAGFRKWLPASNVAKEAAPSGEIPAGNEPLVTYRIRFRPDPDLFRRGTNPLALLNELRDLGRCRIVAQTDDLPSLADLDPENCHTYWDIILTTDQGIEAVRDVFIFVEDDCELKIEVVDDGRNIQGDEARRIGDILVERGDVTQAAIDAVLKSRRLLGELLIENRLVSPEKVEAALAEQQQLQEVRKERGNSASPAETASSIRVPADKLDALVDLVGELVTIQSRLSQTAAGREDAELVAIAEEVERLTAELRDQTLNIRMLPIGTTFSKFKRLVRDLSKDLGKEIELTTSGADTELDKTVIEKLNDPLVHIIRNSIDHGIESPADRQKAGKSREGTIHLCAEHSGDSVILEITDDGKGLDHEAIRRKGIEKGLIGEHEELTEKELFQLLFAPGFSTAQKVTSVSGRGVGMDVVKRAIESLRGTIELTSRKGEGTTIRVKLPLTLAIIESLLVRIGDGAFVLPLTLVEECIELTRQDVARAHGRHLVRVRDQLVPYIPLRENFAIEGEVPEIQQVVVTRCNGQRIGFVVDHVIGEHQTVIKTLGRMYRDVEGLSGATILGDGTVALILDIAQLVRGAEFEEKVAAAG